MKTLLALATALTATAVQAQQRTIYVSGASPAAVEIMQRIREGKDDSKGCLSLATKETADAILEVGESVGPATWTGEGTAVTKTAVLKWPNGEVIWTGKKTQNIFEQSLLKQLTRAMDCKGRAKRR